MNIQIWNPCYLCAWLSTCSWWGLSASWEENASGTLLKRLSSQRPGPRKPVLAFHFPFSYIGKPGFLLPVTAEEAEALRARQGRAGRGQWSLSPNRVGKGRTHPARPWSTVPLRGSWLASEVVLGLMAQGMASSVFHPTEACTSDLREPAEPGDHPALSEGIWEWGSLGGQDRERTNPTSHIPMAPCVPSIGF